MTFKELEVGQRFRIARRGGRDVEWVKIEPVRFPAGHILHNAVRVGGDQRMNFGHSTKVFIPPYGDTTQANRQQKRYHRLKTVVQSAGWGSVAELETAYLTGAVAVPQKPN